MLVSIKKAEQFSLCCFILYGILILWLSLKPGSASQGSIPHIDKVAHFLAYLGFALLSTLWLNTFCIARRLLLGLFIFGLVIEYGQSFMPFRQMSALDLVANTAGALTGTILAYRLHARLKRVFI